MISPFKRISNLWKLSGIAVPENSHKDVALDQMAQIFRSPDIPKPPKQMAKIISMNPQDDNSA